MMHHMQAQQCPAHRRTQVRANLPNHVSAHVGKHALRSPWTGVMGQFYAGLCIKGVNYMCMLRSVGWTTVVSDLHAG